MLRKVAIDASSAGSGGAVRYLSRMCPALSEASPDTSFYLLNRASQLSRLPSLPANFTWVEIPEYTKSRPLRVPWLQIALPRIIRRLDVDVLLAASDVSTLRPPCPLVLMVHNINPLSTMRSQIWSRGKLVQLAVQRELVRRCARRADKVVFVSAWSRQAMSRGLGIPLEKSTVVHHGVDDAFRWLSKSSTAPNDGRKFLLVVSSVLEHKNLNRLLEAYSGMLRSLGRDLDLVIAGPIGSVDLHRCLERRLANEGLSTKVRFLGSVPSEKLLTLYSQAEMLVFPSLEETFGLPLIEAMAAGLPVVASNTSVMPEICEDAACYFDPFDVADITRAMVRVLTDTSLREALVQKGLERSSAFSWSVAAKGLVAVMNRASRSPGTSVRIAT